MLATNFHNAIEAASPDKDLQNQVMDLYDKVTAANFDTRDPEGYNVRVMLFNDGSAFLVRYTDDKKCVGELVLTHDHPDYEEIARGLVQLAEREMKKHPELVSD